MVVEWVLHLTPVTLEIPLVLVEVVDILIMLVDQQMDLLQTLIIL